MFTEPWIKKEIGQEALFRGLKRSGRGVDHPLPSSAEDKGRVELYLYSTSAFMACSKVNFTFALTG